MKNFSLIVSFCLLCGITLNAQAFKKSTRLGLTFYPQPEAIGEVPSDANEGYIVPNIYLESERRFLKYFTIGSETNFGWYRFSSSSYDFEMNSYNLRFELQGKVSIPFYDYLEAFAQYGIGYSGVWNQSQHADWEDNLYIDYLSKTLSVGITVFLFDGFGLSAEVGQMSHRSFKTMSEIVESSYNLPGNIPGLDEHIENQTAYLKLGLVFSID